MKTFEEALKKVMASPALQQNLADGTAELHSEEFTEFIMDLVELWLGRAATLNSGLELKSWSATTLHAAFQAGLLVGMEMEKE